MTTKLLEIKQIYKRFGGIKAIDGLSFDVHEGESVALIGPNGAGKTTVFSLIMGQLKLNSGSIQFDGTDISKKTTYARVDLGVSRTYQVTRPFMDMSVIENIRIGMMEHNIWKMIRHIPDIESEKRMAESVGFDEKDFFKKPSELSMGDLRKLELARTLATKPKLILLDEVFAGLTAGEIEQMSSLLKSKREDGMTFVIVSHDLPSLKPLVDRAIGVSFGSKIIEGSFEEVMENKKFKNIYLGTEID